MSTKQDKTTNNNVLNDNCNTFKSDKCFGNFKVQYNIWEIGKIKLIKNTKKQTAVAKKDL